MQQNIIHIGLDVDDREGLPKNLTELDVNFWQDSIKS